MTSGSAFSCATAPCRLPASEATRGARFEARAPLNPRSPALRIRPESTNLVTRPLRAPYGLGMRVRRAEQRDHQFLLEMARLASGLDDRPLPSANEPTVLAVLPGPADLALLAADDPDHRLGAAWWHFHEPPLVVDERGAPLPEIIMAVQENARGRGIGSRLLEGLALEAAERFGDVALNVHLRNPALRLYMRSGFRVAGKGRGWYGVAMVRSLGQPD